MLPWSLNLCHVVLPLSSLCPIKICHYYIKNSILKVFFLKSVFIFSNSILNLLHPYMDIT